jgi:hypothetical protein
MKAGRSDVVDLFSKWKDEDLVIRWDGNFDTCAFGSFGSIVTADDSKLWIKSRDGSSQFVLRMSQVIHFEYADSRTVEGAAKKYKECVVCFLTKVPDMGNADRVAIAALDPDYKP